MVSGKTIYVAKPSLSLSLSLCLLPNTNALFQFLNPLTYIALHVMRMWIFFTINQRWPYKKWKQRNLVKRIPTKLITYYGGMLWSGKVGDGGVWWMRLLASIIVGAFSSIFFLFFVFWVFAFYHVMWRY